MQFSLPYIDQPVAFWNSLAVEAGDVIREVYFPMGRHLVPSGRPMQPQDHLGDFLAKASVPKAVLVNPLIFPEPVSDVQDLILNELRFLRDNYQIMKVTASSPQLCGFIKANLPHFEVTASVLMGIHNEEQIDYLPVVDALTVDTAILRNLTQLRKLRGRFSGIIKLLVNEGCLPGCPYRAQHFYEMGREELSRPESLCRDLLAEKPWLRLKSAWIPPQFLHYYEGVYDVIKLAGRVTLQNPAAYLRVFRAYREGLPLRPDEIGAGPAGLAEAIPVSAAFFEQTLRCDKNCGECNICREYYHKHHGAC